MCAQKYILCLDGKTPWGICSVERKSKAEQSHKLGSITSFPLMFKKDFRQSSYLLHNHNFQNEITSIPPLSLWSSKKYNFQIWQAWILQRPVTYLLLYLKQGCTTEISFPVICIIFFFTRVSLTAYVFYGKIWS